LCKILLSPGPGVPEEAGPIEDIIRKYGATKSILGVYLGQQTIWRSVWRNTI
jgi:anthranilate synthase component 2